MSVSVIEIIKAISDKLRGLGYPVKDVDITKEIPRPCLVVEADGIVDDKAAVGLAGEQISLTVYYFAERREKGYTELLKCQQDVKQLLGGALRVADGFYITVDDLDFSVNKSDMALVCNFEVYTVQDITDDEAAETMDELEVSLEG